MHATNGLWHLPQRDTMDWVLACVTSKNKGLSEEGIEGRRVAHVLPELELQRPGKLDQGLNQELLLSYAIENPHTHGLLKKCCNRRESEIIMESYREAKCPSRLRISQPWI